MQKMLSEFEQKVAGFVRANALFDSADAVLLAVSGGADSMALLHAMCALKSRGILSAAFSCAHINHQLRGAEADEDEAFVRLQAEELKLRVTSKRIDVHGFARANRLSIETAARKLRRETLLAIAGDNGCSGVVTGHQKNDNAETVLQRLARGTGYRGLAGIWPGKTFGGDVRFVRPLLCVTRDEIVTYLRKQNIEWRVDHTNADCGYRRNYIRHRLLPALQEQCSGSVVERLYTLARSAQRFYSLVCSQAEAAWPELAEVQNDKVTFSLHRFMSEPQMVRVALIRRGLAALGCGERDLTQRHYEGIVRLAEGSAAGKKLMLPGRFLAQRDCDALVLAPGGKKGQGEERTKECAQIKIPGQTRFARCVIEAAFLEAPDTDFEKFKAQKSGCVEWFDRDKLKLPLSVRFRSAGDRFWPLGMPAEKKVGKFLTAAQVPQRFRRKVIVVTDREKIIWVCPIRISEQAKVTDQTQRILQLRIADML
jgi:tRNA(Ile)-lysidine synthase